MFLPNLSVVIPFYNESGNVIPLVQEIMDCLSHKLTLELVLVDDGSTDETYADILAAQECCAVIRALRHQTRCGQSVALRTGIKEATYSWIVTLDGDGQNNPADIIILLEALFQQAEGSKIVIFGNRSIRHDDWLRRFSSVGANLIRRSILGDSCIDSGCALKLFPRDGFLDIPFFDHVHRFLPPLFQYYGYSVINVPVGHRARKLGKSKYTFFGRLMEGFFDLLGVLWLKKRSSYGNVIIRSELQNIHDSNSKISKERSRNNS